MASIELNSNLFSFQTNERERGRERACLTHIRGLLVLILVA